ncbi:two-component regulator propeller domain-containing protein [Pontibacter sp. BT731]|uniref:two-component regulator propeller domain-containing protein n=1 Tax=Pontibacter coccineus TaxID=3063328 RepID=UPI0026E1ACBD|nr:two-component regulator propeller domain-containing protein [Pontibacter sp. BT731]MDO6389374.1 two-component regulator propeller domain-containing protein [Pontibacter sp. BT731]
MRLLALILLLLVSLPSKAQQFNFRNWSLEQGLPQSQVNDILQDGKGQLWVATLGGLSRFDGSTFHTYTKREGMSSNSISCLLLDSRERIWIGTTDRGLMLLTGDSFEVFDQGAGLPPGGVYSIAEDNEGIIWAATDSGVYSLAKSGFVRYADLPHVRYNAVLFSATNELWAGSDSQGVYRINAKGPTNYTTANSTLPYNSINALSQSPDGTIWIGTANGAATFRLNKLENFELPAGIESPNIRDFTTDNYGHQWLSLRLNGVLKYDGKEFQHLTRYSGLRTDRVNCITTDREGNIWIGTTGHGLMQYRNPWFVHFFDMGQVKEPVISALAQDTKGRVWLGTDDGHAAFMESGILNWLQTDIWPKGTTLHSMWVANENDVWVCSSNGLYRLGPGKVAHYGTAQGLPSAEIHQAMPMPNGDLLLATGAGLAILPADQQHIRPLPQPHLTGKVYALHRDRSGRIWIGAEKGVFRYENNRVAAVKGLGETGFREVLTITEDATGTLYFGGFNYGILAWHDKWKAPKVYNSRNGLPNEGIKSLFVDNTNHLWVGTSRGVLKVQLDQLHDRGRLTIRSYANQEGFRGLEVSSKGITQTPDGTVWFATAKGLTMYLPEMDRRNQVYPHIIITNIMLFQKPTDWAGMGYTIDSSTELPVNLRLPYNRNHLTFDFHGISLTAPDRVRYRYRLKGHDEQWSAVTDHSFATYASLDPGSYTFQLLAANSDGYWTPSPLTYTFTIVPPVWRREWFIVLMVLVATGATISVVRLRERSLVKLNTLLEQKVLHRTQLLEEKNREKEILLKEIHHRVKNNLQIIMSMLNLQTRRVQDPKALEVMQSVRGRVRSMAILHERLYQHEDLASIDLSAYMEAICEGLGATYGIRERHIKIKLDIPTIMVEADTALSLGLIVNELVSNSIKYAFPDRYGQVAIYLRPEQQNDYTLTVEDDGVGLPVDFEERRKKSFGLQLVSSLAKKLGGNIAYQNNNGTKSILYFVLTS